LPVNAKKKKKAVRLAVHDGTNWAGTPKRLSGNRKIAAAVTLARQGTET
jgi:hypothetical protein